jgi:hypothetical protein
MSITVIAMSDSHASTLRGLPARLCSALSKADIIVHAGDLTDMSLLLELRATGQTVAVAGNMDSTAVKIHLPHRQLFTANGRTIGVAHGFGAPTGIAQRVRALFPENPDLIVFGHSHVPFTGVMDGVLMVNPGPASSGYARISIGEEVCAQLVTA